MTLDRISSIEPTAQVAYWDLDVFSGASVRLGVDFLSFRRYDRRESFVRATGFLFRAHKDCLKNTPGATELTEAQFMRLADDVRRPPAHLKYAFSLGQAEVNKAPIKFQAVPSALAENRL